MKNIFNRLFKYKHGLERSPTENFITESFVHLLDFSLENNTDFLVEFCKMLNVSVDKSNYNGIFIDTQRSFETKYDLFAIPDITIQMGNTLIFIEVKFESGINEYSLPDHPDKKINQVEKYQAIKYTQCKHRHLFTLVARSSFTDYSKKNKDFKREMFWYEVYELIRKYKSSNSIETYLHNQILTFMETNNIAVPKVSYELIKGMESLLNLFNQIENVLNKLKIPHNKSFGYSWTGYYIFKDAKKVDRDFGFIGTYWDGEKLIFEFNDKQAQQNIEGKNMISEFERESDSKAYCKYFTFEEQHYFCLKSDEQLIKLEDWIKSNYDKLVSLS